MANKRLSTRLRQIAYMWYILVVLLTLGRCTGYAQSYVLIPETVPALDEYELALLDSLSRYEKLKVAYRALQVAYNTQSVEYELTLLDSLGRYEKLKPAYRALQVAYNTQSTEASFLRKQIDIYDRISRKKRTIWNWLGGHSIGFGLGVVTGVLLHK